MSLFFLSDGFRLQDNKTNAELGPKKKEFVEQFTSEMSACKVYDIIEENGQELYYCRGDSTITRNFDSKTWHSDTTGIYEAKNYTLKVYGNFTRSLHSHLNLNGT